VVNLAEPLPPDDRMLTGPIYTQERFLGIMWDEYRRFVHPPWASSAERTWASPGEECEWRAVRRTIDRPFGIGTARSRAEANRQMRTGAPRNRASARREA
jgi:hypothetical protein